MKEEKLIDQSPLAESIAEKIAYEFIDSFLVKPLDPVKVKKEFSTPVDTTIRKDENGVEAQDFEEVAKEVKEVDSDYRKAVVIKTPYSYNKFVDDESNEDKNMYKINVGDVVIFRDVMGRPFDLVRDSRLIRYFDIVAVEK